MRYGHRVLHRGGAADLDGGGVRVKDWLDEHLLWRFLFRRGPRRWARFLWRRNYILWRWRLTDKAPWVK